MATALSNLLALLALDESAFVKGLDSSKQATESFAGNLATVGGAIALGAVTAVGTAIVSVGTAAFDAAETVDEAFDFIAVTTGATGDQLEQLRDDFEAVFSSIPTDAQSAADAISILNARLDISGTALQDIAKPLLEVTRILGGDLTANTENFTRVIGDWNIPVEDAAGSLDKLFVAAQTTGADLATLMEQVVFYGAPMRNFGFSFEEAAALLASFAAQGVNTEIVMSGLRIAQGKFIKQGKDMKTGLWETIEAIEKAATSTDALSIAVDIFGAKAAGDMVDTIRAGKFNLLDLVDAMMDTDNAIMDAADATSDWGETWQKFMNNITLKLAPLGEKIREAFGSALDSVVEVFNRPDVQTAITAFADFAVVAIGKIVDFIPVFIDGFFQFVDFLRNNEGIVIGVFAALAAAALFWAATSIVAAISSIAAFWPVLAVIALIGLASYLLYEAWTNNWGGIQEKTAQVIDALIILWGELTENLTAIWNAFKAAFAGDWFAFGENLRIVWDNVWKYISAMLGSILPVIRQAIEDFISSIINSFVNADWSSIGASIAQGILSGITGGLGSLSLFGQVQTNAISSALGAAQSAGQGFLGAPAVAGVSVQAAPLQPGYFAQTQESSEPNTRRDEEMSRMIRDLPSDIARAMRDALLKFPER